MNKLILVVNCGSSSVKFSLVDINFQNNLVKVNFQGLYTSSSKVSIQYNQFSKIKKNYDKIMTCEDAFLEFKKILSDSKDLYSNNICAIAHRVVHAGTKFLDTEIITKELLSKLEGNLTFAPLHLPSQVMGMKFTSNIFSNIIQYAVFDNYFFRNIPDFAAYYAIPEFFTKSFYIRKYGAHGTSVEYIVNRLHCITGDNNESYKQRRTLVFHLGSGSSISATCGNTCVDTSMGFTPLDGLMMSSRSGEIDPSVVLFLIENLKLSIKDVETILNKKSGLRAISGGYSSWTDIEKLCLSGNDRCLLAAQMFCYRAAKYAVSYIVSLGGLDSIVFTGGIGENSSYIRKKIVEKIPLCFGCVLNDNLNNKSLKNLNNDYLEISDPSSLIKIFAIKANEELEIAIKVKNKFSQ